MNPIEWAKEHPIMTVGVVIVGGLGLYLLLGGGGSSASTSGGSNSAALADALQYQESQNTIAAQANAQASAQGFQLTQQAQAIAGNLALQTEQDKTAITEQNTAAGVANNQNANEFQLGMAAIGAQLQGLISNNDTSISIAQIAANENLGIAQTNANVAVTESNNNRVVAVTQANDNASVQKTISNNSLIGNVVGGLLSIF